MQGGGLPLLSWALTLGLALEVFPLGARRGQPLNALDGDMQRRAAHVGWSRSRRPRRQAVRRPCRH